MANQITITGNMGRPGRLNHTGSGTPVWGFSLAFTPRRKNGETWEDAGPTQWFDVSVWGEEGADLAERYGDAVGQATVTGRLGTREWEGSTQLMIAADAVTIRPKRQQSQPQQQGGWDQSTGAGGWGGQEPPF